MDSVGTFRAKEKITAKPQQVVDWTFAEKPRRREFSSANAATTGSAVRLLKIGGASKST
jgi:hypothetical protein